MSLGMGAIFFIDAVLPQEELEREGDWESENEDEI